MLASQRLPDHAKHAEVLVVKLPQIKELFDCRFLLTPTAELWDKPGIFNHREYEEIRCEAEENRKQYIQNWE